MSYYVGIYDREKELLYPSHTQAKMEIVFSKFCPFYVII